MNSSGPCTTVERADRSSSGAGSNLPSPSRLFLPLASLVGFSGSLVPRRRRRAAAAALRLSHYPEPKALSARAFLVTDALGILR